MSQISRKSITPSHRIPDTPDLRLRELEAMWPKLMDWLLAYRNTYEQLKHNHDSLKYILKQMEDIVSGKRV